MIVEALLTSRRLDVLLGGEKIFDVEVAERLGSALGRWHRYAPDLPGAAPADPWLLHIDQPTRLAVLETDEQLATVLERILQDPACRDIPSQLRASWRSDALIHGDVRFANILVCASPPAIRFVDWETCGQGDSAWDVGAAAQEYLSAAIGLTDGDPRQIAEPSVRALLRGYREEREELECTRLAPFVAGRVLMRAIQLANWDGDVATANRSSPRARARDRRERSALSGRPLAGMNEDLRQAADFLARRAQAGSAELDESALAEELYAWYLNVTPLPRHGGTALPYELSLPRCPP